MPASGKPFSASTRESCQVSLSIRVISIQLRDVCVFAPSSVFDAVSHGIMTVLAIFEPHENLIRWDELIINGNGWPFAVINAEKFPWNFFSDLKWRHSSFTQSYIVSLDERFIFAFFLIFQSEVYISYFWHVRPLTFAVIFLSVLISHSLILYFLLVIIQPSNCPSSVRRAETLEFIGGARLFLSAIWVWAFDLVREFLKSPMNVIGSYELFHSAISFNYSPSSWERRQAAAAS